MIRSVAGVACGRTLNGVVMRFTFLSAVVVRIVKYPIRGVAWRGLRPCRKGIVKAIYVCNITWGYVALTVAGDGGGSNSQRGMGLQGV